MVAKALIERVYGEAPRFSYFTGCSQGGHQGLAEAQRYPDDFDGIVAGAPAAVLTELNSFHRPWMAAAEFDATGAAVLSAADLPVVHQVVLDQCDAVDGLADGQLEDPRACAVDLSAVRCPGNVDADGCLTAAQLDVVRAIWSGPVDAGGRRLYPGGAAPGSELAWAGWIVPAQPGEGTAAQDLGGPWLEHLALAPGIPGPDPPVFDQTTFDRVGELAGLYDTVARPPRASWRRTRTAAGPGRSSRTPRWPGTTAAGASRTPGASQRRFRRCPPRTRWTGSAASPRGGDSGTTGTS